MNVKGKEGVYSKPTYKNPIPYLYLAKCYQRTKDNAVLM
jgi:hypothetical protein